jgi:thiol-disulfide isomerase/thioredoxin
MRNLFFIGLCFVLIVSCKIEKKSNKVIGTTPFTEVKDVVTVDYSGLEPMLNKKDDKIYVVNFWATWCLPCVKELPYFEKINQQYKDKSVEVILVSLDFPEKKATKLIPFINKKKLRSKVVHLDDVNEQVWIAKVDENWEGAIPVTIIYNKNKRKFYQQPFTFEELEKEIKSFIN